MEDGPIRALEDMERIAAADAHLLRHRLPTDVDGVEVAEDTESKNKLLRTTAKSYSCSKKTIRVIKLSKFREESIGYKLTLP